jgi:hypothetical protein
MDDKVPSSDDLSHPSKTTLSSLGGHGVEFVDLGLQWITMRVSTEPAVQRRTELFRPGSRWILDDTFTPPLSWVIYFRLSYPPSTGDEHVE